MKTLGISSGADRFVVLFFLYLAAVLNVCGQNTNQGEKASRQTAAETVSTIPMPAVTSVCGRVVTADGRGVSKANLNLTGGFLTSPYAAMSNPFGYFCFHDIDVGQTYMVTASSKRYEFVDPVQFFVLLDEINNLEFVAVP